MSDNVKVMVAAVLGTGSPAANWFFSNAGPILELLLTVGQIGVAIVTILYIWRKLRKLK